MPQTHHQSHGVHVSEGDGVGVGSSLGAGLVGSAVGPVECEGSEGPSVPAGPSGSDDEADGDGLPGRVAEAEAPGVAEPSPPSPSLPSVSPEREAVTGTTVGASTGPASSGSTPEDATGALPVAVSVASLTYSAAPLSPPGSMASSARLRAPTASTTPVAVSSSVRPRRR